MLWRTYQTLQCYRTGTVFSVSLGVEPEDPETSLFGKAVSDLQTGILFNDKSVNGTLKYVTGYTGYSGDPDLQEGNFLAIKATASENATVTVELTNGHSGPVTLDSDMNAVIRIENKNTQKLKVVATSPDGSETTKFYSLKGLVCETAE